MQQLAIGIDPGKDGGIALLEDGKLAQCYKMPVFYARKGTKRREYDDATVMRWLRGIAKRDADIVAAYETYQPHTDGPLTDLDIYQWAEELMESISRHSDIGADARQQYLRSVLTEKIRLIEKRCTGGKQGITSAASQAGGISTWRVHFKWAGIKAMPVYPATWQARILTGYTGEDSKAKAFRAAQSLWPDRYEDFLVKVTKRRKGRLEEILEPHKGMVDAACIAEFARREMSLGPVAVEAATAGELF